MSKVTSKIETQEVSSEDLDELLGVPGADSMVTADGENQNKKPSFFSNDDVDLSFMDEEEDKTKDPDEEEEPDDDSDNKSDKDKDKDKDDDQDDDDTDIDDIIESTKEDDDNPSDNNLGSTLKALIDDELLIPFDEDKPLEEYSSEDFKELLKANFDEQKRQLEEKTPKEFFEALPQELQYAAKYVAEGGKDLKNLFSHLAQREEKRSYDPSKEKDQELIIRDYLKATNFGNDEDIDTEIEDWKDMGKLEEKASKFKPKLDKMEEQILEQKIKEQEQRKQKQIETSKKYANSVHETLSKGDLNGLKLDPKKQDMLFQGLVHPNYPSVTGKSTNLFGHLIEKYQFVEPRHDLIAEALYLLQDPDGYRDNIKKLGKNAANEETRRKLKTEQSNKQSSSSQEIKDNDSGRGKKKTIQKPSKGFFARD